MNDLISRQAAIDAIKRYESAYSYDLNNGLILAMNAVADVPTIDPVKHGKWEKISDRNYKCSCCNAWWSVDRDSTMKDFKHCPNCGALMDKGEPDDH